MYGGPPNVYDGPIGQYKSMIGYMGLEDAGIVTAAGNENASITLYAKWTEVKAASTAGSGELTGAPTAPHRLRKHGNRHRAFVAFDGIPVHDGARCQEKGRSSSRRQTFEKVSPALREGART